MNKKIQEIVLIESNFKMDLSKLSEEILKKGAGVTQQMSITVNKGEKTKVIKIIVNIKGVLDKVEFLEVHLIYLAELYENEEMNRDKSSEIVKEIYPKIKEQIENFYRNSPQSTLKAPVF